VDNDVDAMTGFYGVGDENGCVVEWNKEFFADDEVGAYIRAGDRFRFIGDPTKQSGRVDFSGVSGGAKSRLISAEELQGVGP
jgi:hypothetical protein